MIDTMNAKQDYHTSQTKTKPGFGEVRITIHDRLQPHDEIHVLRTPADNPDQSHLIFQCLTGLDIETRATIDPTTRNFLPPMMGISQLYFDSLQRTISYMNYLDYAF